MNQVQVMAAAGGVLLATAAPVGAQVYKSVDEYGNVVYSSSPFTGGDPDQAESVRIDPGPTGADRAAAERRMQALQPPGGSAALPVTTPPAEQPPPVPPKQVQPIDWQEDEAILRARTTNREHRRAGGFAGETRSRSGATLPSQRSSR